MKRPYKDLTCAAGERFDGGGLGRGEKKVESILGECDGKK